MTQPGDRLRSLALRICAPATMERLIDPVIEDMQCEHAEASGQGHRWRRAGIRAAGTLAFWRVLVSIAIDRSMEGAYEWAAADRWTVGRTLGGSTVVTAAIACLVAILTFVMTVPAPLKGGGAARTIRLLLYLLPQAIPLAVPAGLLIGILYGLRERPVTGPGRRAIALVAICCALASFLWVDRIVPEVNQAFRHVSSGIPYNRLARGANELTFAQLAQKIAESDGRPGEVWQALPVTSPVSAPILRFSYQARLALSLTPIIAGLFALRLAAAGRCRRSFAIGILAMTTYVTFYFGYDLMPLIESNRLGSPIASGIGWIPNLIFLLGTLALAKHARPSASGTATDRPGPSRSG